MADRLPWPRSAGDGPTGPMVRAVSSVCRPLTIGTPDAYNDVIEQIGDVPMVFLGEATHGTHEFYAIRQQITKRLIEEKGFRAIAIEGDWPDAARVDAYVRTGAGTARSALSQFRAFPNWMWGNQDVLSFIDWLRTFNLSATKGDRSCGFYGLDLYSMYSSMEAVLEYLERQDPKAAEYARERFACFEPISENMEIYALLVNAGSIQSCESEILRVLHDLRQRRVDYSEKSPDYAFFDAEQNVLATKAAENFYRAMLRGDPDSWNVRDCYMFETFQRLRQHLGEDTKIVVWAHNTHVGDYSKTEEHSQGYLNIGQLARERFDDGVFLLGFGTYEGTVTAATAWGGPPELKEVPPASPGTYEDLLHQIGIERLFVPTRQLRGTPAASLFDGRRERAIGVVYNPAYEHFGNYFKAALAEQFDGYIFVDRSSAVKPMWAALREAGRPTRRAA
ncbi:MAG TPA: erythromycin esterase family protein [Chloroflexota bacterium]|nr:erythromycin esterase family protein [Chloroflexota bacterium]